MGHAQWTLHFSHQLLQGRLTLGFGEGSWQTQASSSGRPAANSWAVSGAPVRNSCLFLLDVGFVPGLWDAVMSNAQPPSCSLEVLRTEREVTVSGFPGSAHPVLPGPRDSMGGTCRPRFTRLHLAAWGRVSSHVWNRRAPIVPWGLSTVDLVLSPVPPWYLGPMGTSLTDAGELGGVRYL